MKSGFAEGRTIMRSLRDAEIAEGRTMLRSRAGSQHRRFEAPSSMQIARRQNADSMRGTLEVHEVARAVAMSRSCTP